MMDGETPYSAEELAERRLRIVSYRRAGENRHSLAVFIIISLYLLPVAYVIGSGLVSIWGIAASKMLEVVLASSFGLLCVVSPHLFMAFGMPRFARMYNRRLSYEKMRAKKLDRLQLARRRAAAAKPGVKSICMFVGVLAAVIGFLSYQAAGILNEPFGPLILDAIVVLLVFSLVFFLVWRGLGSWTGKALQCRKCGYPATVKSTCCPECGLDLRPAHNISIGTLKLKPWMLGAGIAVALISQWLAGMY